MHYVPRSAACITRSEPADVQQAGSEDAEKLNPEQSVIAKEQAAFIRSILAELSRKTADIHCPAQHWFELRGNSAGNRRRASFRWLITGTGRTRISQEVS